METALTPTRSRRWPRRLALAVLAALVLALILIGPRLLDYARTGTAYGARVACSCRFVGQRSLADCRKDFEPGMGMVRLSEDPQARSVTARVPLIASATAFYRDGPGCQLEPWRD